MYGLKKVLYTCIGMFTAGIVAVSGTLYTLSYAPFGKADTQSEAAFTDKIQSVSEISSASGIDLATAFTAEEDIPADSLNNCLSASLSIKDSVQQAEYYTFKSISDDKTFIYYCQAWEEYASIPYGNETIGSYGCGPTNVAMVVSNLTGKNVTPDKVALLSEKWGFFISGTGTSHAIFEKAADYYGLHVEAFEATRLSVISRLKQGCLVICSVGEGYFTRGGHFLTLRGMTEDGKILIADSYSEVNTETEWDLSFLMSQLKYTQMWAFRE